MNHWTDVLTEIDGWHDYLPVDDHLRLACVSQRLAESQRWQLVIRRVNRIDDYYALALPPWNDLRFRKMAQIVATVVWPLPTGFDFNPVELRVETDDQQPAEVAWKPAFERLERLTIHRGRLIDGLSFTRLRELSIDRFSEGQFEDEMITLPTSLEKLRLGYTGNCRVSNLDQLTRLEKVDLRGYEEEVVMNAPNLREAILHGENISVGFDQRHPNLEVLWVVEGQIQLVCLPESMTRLTIDEQRAGFGGFKRFTRLERLVVPEMRVERHRLPDSLVSLTCDDLWRRPDDHPLPRLTHLRVIDPIYISDLRFGVPGVLEKIEVGGLVDGGWFPEMSSTKIRRGFLLAEGLGSAGLMALRLPPKRALATVAMILSGIAVEFTLLDLFDGWRRGRELRRFGRIGITREADYRKLRPCIHRSVEPAWSTSDGDGGES